ncbi:type II toxin-antitoxin system VapC family toxin [Oceanibaculum indicum]|uniref:PilT protein domain-containing protein n=1 Tax=Oceanibaculum indicum P24 TaxID=1207063 RepID=K2J5B4_9PROT|nr:type II toxin-antitoxin system VapC family toxin [Oceanibaculum indicum]EKE78206.1 PilT protein domain-containing protein [Oceanibaculum indicum P24]
MLALDTHTLLWLMAESPSLGRKARSEIDSGRDDGILAVPAICFWEVALLLRKNRVRLDRPVEKWRQDVLSADIAELPMTGEIGILSVQLADLHGDPADRLIAATCLVHNATLLTADRRLLDWKGGLQMQDARQ